MEPPCLVRDAGLVISGLEGQKLSLHSKESLGKIAVRKGFTFTGSHESAPCFQESSRAHFSFKKNTKRGDAAQCQAVCADGRIVGPAEARAQGGCAIGMT